MHAIIELLSQTEFVRWVQNPDEELNAFWKQWMIAHPERTSDVKLARELLLGMKSTSQEIPSQMLKQEILLKILQDDKKASARLPSMGIYPRRDIFTWNGLNQLHRVVAVLVLGFFLAFLYTLSNPTLIEEMEEPILAEWITKKALKGEKLKVTLPDKSEVWLNSSTEISYPALFEGNERLVKLLGEAFFDVYPDSIRPFVVDASGLLTEALGTSFTVSKGAKSQKTKISLATGNVHITHQDASLDELLLPGQQLIFNEEDKQIHIGDYDWKEEFGWKEGWLVFKKASFTEVRDALENWYGVQVLTINQPTRQWDYSGDYHRQTLDNILASMAYIEKFTYTINDKKVTIKF